MRRFWWLFAIVFVASLVVYTVGTGWISQWTVTSNIRHARRQLEIDKVISDLESAQQALVSHRQRVLSSAAIFRKPDFTATYAVFGQLEQFKALFRSLCAAQSLDAAPTPQFVAATEQLKTYRVPSLSVMEPGTQTILGGVVLATGILTLLLMGVRFLGTE